MSDRSSGSVAAVVIVVAVLWLAPRPAAADQPRPRLRRSAEVSTKAEASALRQAQGAPSASTVRRSSPSTLSLPNASRGGEGAQAPVAAPTSVGGCPAEILAFHTCALEKAKTFDPPRTPGGKPDMQGYWRGRLTMAFSVEGVSETEPLTRSLVMPWTPGPGMIVDPPDRKIPYQPWAAQIGRKGQNHQKYIDPRTACGSGGVPRLFMQDAHQLLQREDYVVWLFEDHHVYRIIPTNGQPHLGQDIKLWQGDAAGRWEGNTLVVDLTNVNGYNWLDDSGNFYTDAAHLVERFTLIDADTIHYEITFEDPKAYTRPWKMAWPIAREKEPGFQLLEEACWEGERDLPRFLELGYRYYFGEPWRPR